LGKTSITAVGVRRLADCKKLILLEIPSMTLDEAALDAIAGCTRLQFLLLDENRLADSQLVRLQQALPRVRLNGKTWKRRQLAP